LNVSVSFLQLDFRELTMRTKKQSVKKLVSVLSLLLSGGLIIAGCTNNHGNMSFEPISGEANSADVMFAQMMIPHHEQAVVMADFALQSATDPQLIELAQEIKDAQDPEIDLMKSWLDAWGIPMMPADQAMQAHGSHGMQGMLGDDQLDQLENARGEEFDRLFATYMIEHHVGAVAMAQDVLKDGKDPAVAMLAREIIATQEKEILQLQAFLNSAGGDQALAITPALGHIHGGVIDSGSLLLGTHAGLHRVDIQSGNSTQVGESMDDLMAFAGTAATSLVASGHPGMGSTMMNPMGLVRSNDGGLSWQSVSMAGMIDFHSLAVNGSEIVGWDTRGPLQYSRDGGSTWTTGPVVTPTSLVWFDDQIWLATPDQGLLIWEPGQMTVSAEGSSAVLLSASPSGDSLWRIDRDGSVHRTTGNGNWTQLGTVNRVETLVADSEVAYAVTSSSVEVIRLT
jgi:uncharacterized protein (DUF305 family)